MTQKTVATGKHVLLQSLEYFLTDAAALFTFSPFPLPAFLQPDASLLISTSQLLNPQ